MGIVISAPVSAVKLVGTVDQPDAPSQRTQLGGERPIDFDAIARAFTTGTHSRGYVITGFQLVIEESSSSRLPMVGIYESDGASPGDKVYDLSGNVSSTGYRVFLAPYGAVLDSNTTYFFVIHKGSGTGTFKPRETWSYDADSNPQAGWSIAQVSLYSRNSNDNWDVTGGGGLKIGVFGRDRAVNSAPSGKPSIIGTVQIGQNLIADVLQITDPNGLLSGATFNYQWIRVDGGRETEISGATLRTYVPVSDDVGKRLKVRVTFTDSGGYDEVLVSDASGVVRMSDGNAPAEGKPVVNGIVQLYSFLTGDYSVLTADTSSIGDEDGLPGSFSYQWVHVDGSTETNILGAMGSNYILGYDDVGKQLKVRVTFTDNGGYDEVLVSDATVTVPDAVVLVGNINRRLGVNGIQIDDNTFVAQEFTAGNHLNGYNVSSIVVKVEDASSTRVPVVSIYSSDGSRPVTKLYEFSGSVAEAGDRNFTVPVGVTLSPNTNYFVHIAGGSGSGSFRIRPGHSSDGGFDSSSSLPGWSISSSHFRSGNGGSSWYSRTSFNPRFAVLGVPRLSPLPVNNPPVFSGSSSFSVSENVRTVGTVVVDDGDSPDNITSYNISGGVDSARFSITDEGVLSFKSAPNFESPSDSGRDNEYVVGVKVTSGSNGRERFSSRVFTVNVTDVDEPPLTPGAPGLTSINSTSLFVSWSAPGNAGPRIIDYAVQYALDGESFSVWVHDSGSRSTIITGLSAGSLYYVRVRAVNDEGNSSWSESSYVVTDSANPVSVSSGLLVSNINQQLGVDGIEINDNKFVTQGFTTGNYSNGYSVSRIVVKVSGASSTRVPVVSIYSSDGSRPVTKLYEFSGSVTETGDRNFTVPVGVTLSPNTNYFVHVAGGSGSGSFKVRYGNLRATGFDSSSLPGWSISTSNRRSSDGGSSWSSRTGFNPRFSVWGGERSGSVPDVSEPPVDVNNPPVFTSGSSFSVDENGAPWGVWSDGITIWVVDDDDDKVYAYTLSNNSHDSGKDIGLAGRHDNPRGAWSDGETMWVVHSEGLTGDKVYAYSLSSGSRVSGQDFDVESSYSIPRGIWSDNETIWVANYYSFADGGRIRAYNKSDKSRHSGKDFTVGSHEDVAGIWSDGNSMWVAEEDGNRVYGYRMSDRKRDSDRDFRLSSDNRNARDIWSDGVVVYVSDDSDDTLYSYVLADVLGSYVYSVDVSYVGRTTANLDVVVYKPGGVDDVYVRYRVDGSSASWINRSRSVSSENVQFSLSGLDANTTYDLEVSLHDDFPNSATAKLEFVTLVDSPPLFSSGNFSVNENSVSVGTVEAEDPDTGDSITGYNISGGADFSLFEITNAGILSFVSAPDFEAPGDDDKNNEYVLIVSATGGSGNRRLSANQTVVVSVVDVDEPPLRPSAPVLSSPSSTSLSVSWGIPDNTGPSITDYDVGYGLSSGGPFVDWPHSDASRSATITGLNDSTLYFVRVLARNAEGVSGWSEVSSFTTGSVSPPQVVNNRPVFTSSSTFSVNENTRSVGTVVASDGDGGDSVTGYNVSGGVDGNLFSITNAGSLSFKSAQDFENPADVGGDNVYDLVVTATSGTGSRVRTATQAITVTVTDVAEGRLPPTVNNLPVFTSGSSFSVDENGVSVGVVVASDGDAEDSVTGYNVSGGVDGNLFSITNAGSLSFKSAQDFENPADVGGDNVYDLVVTATSGTGSRVRTATQAITVTVTDVAEGRLPPTVNNLPVFTSGSSFSVDENGVSVGVVVASDGDAEDSVTGYNVSGGVDSARFTITSGGVLSFNSAPDFESPSDSDDNNVYSLVVTATSGTGSRVRTATQAITVTVTDVAEGDPVTPPRNVVLVYNCG